LARPHLKNKIKIERLGGIALVVECLPSIGKNLCSIYRTAKNVIEFIQPCVTLVLILFLIAQKAK
jgi:hypothetical protein